MKTAKQHPRNSSVRPALGLCYPSLIQPRRGRNRCPCKSWLFGCKVPETSAPCIPAIMLREGARPEVVRDNLGHANIGVTHVFFIVSQASFSSLRRNGIKE